MVLRPYRNRRREKSMKRLCAAVILLTLGSFLYGEDPESPLATYQRTFARGDLAAKLSAVEAASQEGGATMGPLYVQAVDFSLANVSLLGEDPVLLKLTETAVRELGPTGNVHVVPALWRVFNAFRDTGVRIAALKSLAALGTGDGLTVSNLNLFLSNQNKLRRSGAEVDQETVYACVEALGALGDPSSYGPLFAALTSSYPERIALQAQDSLLRLKGDYKGFLEGVIRDNPVAEKLVAFRSGMNNDGFSGPERGELAETALKVALDTPQGGASEGDLSQLRYAAVKELTSLRWARSAPEAIKNFYLSQTEFSKNSALKDSFIEAIDFLGAVSSSEAAQALSLQLGLINADMERTKSFDRDILLAVIEALGSLGDKVAFDYLLYIGYLDYPDDIKNAAREALNRLTW